jgi:parallel beta helix pectate lyase-like protein
MPMTMIYSKTLRFLYTGAVVAGFSTLARAQATRTWVSGVGDDANPCSRTAPCLTFAGAISKTAAGGEINVLDPGGFGAVTITKAISIISDNIEAGVLGLGTNGIVVNVSSTDQVVLDGLDIEGQGIGLDGIKVIGGGATFIRNCKIRHFSGNGVNVVGTANARVIVENSQILFNAGGLNVQGAGGAANAATIAHSIVDLNSSFAVQVNGTNNAIGLMANFLTGSPVAINALMVRRYYLSAQTILSGDLAPRRQRYS